MEAHFNRDDFEQIAARAEDERIGVAEYVRRAAIDAVGQSPK